MAEQLLHQVRLKRLLKQKAHTQDNILRKCYNVKADEFYFSSAFCMFTQKGNMHKKNTSIFINILIVEKT